MKKILTAALLAGGLVMTTATAAFAHTSSVSASRVCTDDGETKTVVTFNNDYQLTATVTYHWGSDSTSTVVLAARESDSSTKPVVSLPSHDVGTLKYHVTWSDNFRQPSEGDSTLTIGPLTDCHAVTTTSSSTSSTSTSTSTSTTTTSTTQPPAITATVQPTVAEKAVVVPTEVLGVTLTQPGPAPVGGVQTGGGGTSQSGNPLLPLGVGLGCVALIGLVAMQLRRPAVS